MADPTVTGRILRGVGGLYWIDGPDGVLLEASARGIFRKTGEIPTAGDQVDCVPSGDPDRPWQIVGLHPRFNSLVRPSVANLDGLAITLSADHPPPDYLLVDKLLILCFALDIEPLLILTKTDLGEAGSDMLEPYRPVGCQLLEACPQDADSIGQLQDWLSGKTVCLAGQSGVGKSTLVNRLFGSEKMAVGRVSDKIGRGRHTTREVVFFPFAGGYLADTPGFSTLELHEVGIRAEQVTLGYPEIGRLTEPCRFQDCRHLGEPGCALPGGPIHPERLARYRLLRTQLEAVNQYAKKGRGRTMAEPV